MLPNAYWLARRAKEELAPAVLGARSEHSIYGRVVHILAKGADSPGRDWWTPEQSDALKEFICREEGQAKAAKTRIPTNVEIADRAMGLLVPGMVGQRSWASVNSKIGILRRSD